ncbi:MAG: TetR/AcrR family transcriptional regulator [Acidobacteria bacterium]|nr:TetR/AcrR family transcriptional regulator [Acidobacteriota bacterium]
MKSPAVTDSRRDILRTAARLFQERGYEATSMQDIASALNLSKGALYHHFQSKDEILFEIMNHGLDVFDEEVLDVVRQIPDPVERLRACIARHIGMLLRGRDREITVILHENRTLPSRLRKRINARKRSYIHFLEDTIQAVQSRLGTKNEIHPRAAAFALLGMINWVYQWYRPDGSLSEEKLIRDYTTIFFDGLTANQ